MRKLQHLVLLAAIMTFSYVAVAADSLEKMVQDNVALYNQEAENMVIETQRLDNAGTDVWDRLQFQIENNKLKITYSYSIQTLKDPISFVTDMVILYRLSGSGFGEEMGSWALFEIERMYNAKQGAPGPRYEILNAFNAQMRRYRTSENSDPASFQHSRYLAQYLESRSASNPTSADFFKLGKSIAEATDKKTSYYLEEQKRSFAKNKREWETWKKQTKAFDILDKSTPKLDDLVRNNDRHGVRKLIESYLPWTMMEPFETAAWRSWLDAIETKATKENSQILFRGVSYDTDIRFQNANGGVGFMSTVLTKNQGNYNRRLRSLAVRRLGQPSEELSKEVFAMDPLGKAPIVTIAQQLADHSGSPTGSSYLSFTTSPKVAGGFAGAYDPGKKKATGGVLAVRVPVNRTMPNGHSFLTNEVEVLLPLIVFPEDVVYFKEISPSGLKARSPEVILSDVMANLSEEDKEILEKTQKLYDSPNALKVNYAQTFLRITQNYSSVRIQCSGVFGN